jgi:hypothetical protein
LAALATGCGTAQKKNAETTFAPQSFESTLVVDNAGKSYKLKADVSLINPKAVRLDVTNTLDLPLAAVVLTESRIEYVLYRDKKFYSGKANPHALDPVFPLTVDAETLENILSERLPSPSSVCETDGDVLKSCHGRTGETAYQVEWSKRESTGPLSGRASKITLELPERHVSLKFYLTDWQKNMSNAERFLALRIPPGFKNYPVPER